MFENYPKLDEPAYKAELTHSELTDVIDLALLAGQLLLQYGADSTRIETTVHHIGTGLGCDWLDIVVSPSALTITTTSGGHFRTKIRRVTRIGVNMAIIELVNDLSHRVYQGRLDRHDLRTGLEAIPHLPHEYNRWVTVFMVGLACAAFSRLFGGDWAAFGVTLVAASAAMFARQELTKLYFNAYVVVTVTAFVATCISGLALLLGMGGTPTVAITASVLLLVPGVPLINAAEDMIQGHMLIGFIRGVTGGLISLNIALGILLAMTVLGIEGF